MNSISFKYILISVFILLISSIGGAFITQDLATDEAAMNFLEFGISISAAILMAKLLIYSRATKKLFYKIIFLALTGLTMTWFISTLYLPIFWSTAVGNTPKLIILIIFLFLTISNIIYGFRDFKNKWVDTGLKSFQSEFSAKKINLNWDSIIKKMNVQYSLFIPGMPKGWESAITVILVLFMIAGLNLRSTFPVFSVFAWGIPAIVIASFFLQVTGNYASQAVILSKMEKEMKISFPSA